MTRKIVPAVCDFCAQDVITEMKYSLQINQKGSGKGVFIKSDSPLDMCHDCLLSVCKNGYKPKWIKLKKNDSTGKWDEVDEQTKLNE